ncbi:MAG: CRISPR-associated endonuclease Cas1 [Candidatus Bathyarchaeia archaeon]
MNPLHLSGWGAKIRVNSLKSRSELEVINWREDDRAESTHRFRPRRFPYGTIIIDGHSGYISLQAFHWLSKHKVPVFIMNFDGSLISSVLPPMPVKADLRAAQILAANDPKKKFSIARALVQAKIERSLQVLDWLAERYDIPREIQVTKLEASKLRRASTVPDLRTVEGRVARRYWEAFGKVMPEHLDFQERMTSSHQNNASDPVNLALNYGYGFLEGECRRAINAVGLEPSVGFFHDVSDYQTKQSLVYDLQEPFRWLSDISVIAAFQSEALNLSDFYFTGDDYRYRFEVEAKQRFIDLIRERFNAGVACKHRVLKWDTVIEQKTNELGRFLLEKSLTLDFAEPAPRLQRSDDREVRARILALTGSKARRLGIGKSTLQYLRKNACKDQFTIYKPVMTKLGGWT